MTGGHNLTADLTAGPTTAGTRGCVPSTKFSHERSHVHGGQRSTEWVRLDAFTIDADRRRKWPRRRGDAAREKRRIFHVEKRRNFSSRIHDAQKSSSIRFTHVCLLQANIDSLWLDSIPEKKVRMHRSILLWL